MKVNYIPDGFSLEPDRNYYINPKFNDRGYCIDEPVLIDVTEPLAMSYVKDAQSISINGHDAVYLSTVYSSDPTWKNEKIFILYEEMNRILPVSSWGHADKEELMKIAENIELCPTGNKISTKELRRWSEIIHSEKLQNEKGDDEISKDSYYFEEAALSDMANVHQIGDSFQIKSFPDEGEMTEIPLEASVTDVQVADDLSLLTAEEAICDGWKKLIGPDGKFTSDNINYIKLGDGVNSLNEIVRTEQHSVKLVYVTVEYTNPGSETVYNSWYVASLIPMIRNGDLFQIFNRIDDTCDYVENDSINVGTGVMNYSDVSGGHLGKNYIPVIKPKESVSVHMAWVVNEDELDKLYLDFQGESAFTKEGLKTGYVDLNL